MVAYLDSSTEGPLLLCLHGIGGSSVSFDPLREQLKEDFRVVAWDAPGYAASQDPAEPPGMDGYVAHVVALIDELGGPPPVLLGMSWGGVIAASVAVAHPDRVRALVLGDSTRGSGRTVEGAAAMRARIPELEADGAALFAARRAERLLASTATARQVSEVARAMASSIRMPGYAYAVESMAQTDLTPVLGDIAVPTLVVYGGDDRVTGRVESEALAAGIPDARLREIPGAGHLADQEQPARFAQEVLGFLGGVAGRALPGDS